MRINVTRSSMPSFEEYCEEIRDLWDSHWLTNNGAKLLSLQSELSRLLEMPYVSLFTNGHLALEALIASMKLKGEIITTPFTFASTVHAAVRRGLTPVFADITPDDYTMDPALIEKCITPRTCAILPVHVYGHLCDDTAIRAVADRHGIPVIYDAAHAFAVKKNGVPAAAMGYASMFSFHATKVFNTIEGGCVVTRDAALSAQLDLEKNFGITGPEDVVDVGGNAKMNEFQAAMGLCNLRHLAGEIAARKTVHEAYISCLAGLPGVVLPADQPGVESNYAYFPVFFEGGAAVRDRVCCALAEKGIYARKYFYPIIPDFACYQGMPGFDSALVPQAERISRGIVTLPLYPGLAAEDIDEICRVITEALHE